MIVGRRLLLVALWSAAALVLFMVLNLFFTFGDCMETNRACVDAQNRAATAIPIVVAGIYGLGLGVMLDRWLLGRKH